MARRKILLVENDQELQLAIAIRLKKCGYEVKYAANAQTAALLARQEAPDLVLLGPGLSSSDELERHLGHDAPSAPGSFTMIGDESSPSCVPRSASAGVLRMSADSDDLMDRLSEFFSATKPKRRGSAGPNRKRTVAKRA